MVPIQKKILSALALAFAAALTLAAPCLAKTHRQPAQTAWVGSWAASQQLPEPANALPPEDLRDATLRQIVHLSLGGGTLRVHLSNAFGTEPLHFTSVHIAVPLSGVVALLGGLSVLLGFRTRYGAALIALFLVPVTLTMHAFWNVSDPPMHQMQQISFMKNLSILGGALTLLCAGGGPFSLDAHFGHGDDEAT